MTPREWIKLTRGMHPEDVITLAKVAGAMTACVPFFVATDGRRVAMIEGAGAFSDGVIDSIGQLASTPSGAAH